MALTFNEFYFNGDPNGYTQYGRDQWAPFSWRQDTADPFEAFTKTMTELMSARGMPLTGAKVLVVGCAYGFTVNDLLPYGIDAYGVDISQYAIDRAKENPTIASRVMVGDARVRSSYNSAKTMAGLSGNQRFAMVIDEDVLPCLSDAHAITACTEMRRVSNRVLHRVSVHPIEGSEYNIKTLAEWKTLTSSPVTDWWHVYTTFAE